MNIKNIAFRCAYNDNNSGQADLVGYMGACSKAATIYNVRKGAPWCSLPECPCRGYAMEGLKRPEHPCYESRMLIDWKAYAGFDHDGPESWTPRRILEAGRGSLAFLTTRYPGTSESERFIFAAFLVDEAVSYDEEKSGWVGADRSLKIALRQDETVRFWDHYRNQNRPDYIGWGSGRFRYLDSKQAASALEAISMSVKDEVRRSLARDMADRALRDE